MNRLSRYANNGVDYPSINKLKIIGQEETITTLNINNELINQVDKEDSVDQLDLKKEVEKDPLILKDPLNKEPDNIVVIATDAISNNNLSEKEPNKQELGQSENEPPLIDSIHTETIPLPWTISTSDVIKKENEKTDLLHIENGIKEDTVKILEPLILNTQSNQSMRPDEEDADSNAAILDKDLSSGTEKSSDNERAEKMPKKLLENVHLPKTGIFGVKLKKTQKSAVVTIIGLSSIFICVFYLNFRVSPSKHVSKKVQNVVIHRRYKRIRTDSGNSTLVITTLNEYPEGNKSDFKTDHTRTLVLPEKYFSFDMGGIYTSPCNQDEPSYPYSSFFNISTNIFDTSFIMFSLTPALFAVPYDTNSWIKNLSTNIGDTITAGIFFRNVGDVDSKNINIQLDIKQNQKSSTQIDIEGTINIKGLQGRYFSYARKSHLFLNYPGKVVLDSSFFISVIEQSSSSKSLPRFQHAGEILTTGIDIGEIKSKSYGCLFFQFNIKP